MRVLTQTFPDTSATAQTKAFCFFFSKKKALPCLIWVNLQGGSYYLQTIRPAAATDKPFEHRRRKQCLTKTTRQSNHVRMPISLRILRNLADQAAPRPPLTRPQQEREARILHVGEALLARFGRHGITFALMATALRIGTAALRWHYADLDALLADILRRHLQSITASLDAVPASTPNHPQALRAAYLAATRNPDGSLTSAHLLLTRDRHLLPQDELDPIEAIRHAIARRLAANAPADTIDIADSPWIDAARLEAVLTTVAALPPAIRGTSRPPPNLPAHIRRALETGDLTHLRPPEPNREAA